MPDWKDSVYSDGTQQFVSAPAPEIGETVSIRIRFLEDAPVKHVLVLSFPNGLDHYDEAEKETSERGLVYYRASLKITETFIHYQFVLVGEDTIWFYTQRGLTTHLPDHTYDFKIVAGYRQPPWVKGAVMYQIFPERFANGDPANDVKDGEYFYMGRPSLHMKSWYDTPLPFEEGRAVDFFGGDLDGITQKIPYLQDLGVTVLYLNPIFTSYSTHKYDCNDYFHVDPHFGGDEALERLCSALHAAGMRIILDISINHTGIENKWIKEGKPFYFRNPDGSYKCWWDVDTLPVLDYRNEELRDLVYRRKDSALRKWLRPPYSIDGWRFDVADVFGRMNDVQLAGELWEEVCAALREEAPDVYIMAEDWGDCGQYLQGDRWTTPMNYFGFARIIRQFAGTQDLFLSRQPLLRSIPYAMTAQDVVERTLDHYAKIPQIIADAQMNLIGSHDTPRLHNYPQVTFAHWKSAVISQLLWTGIPCIYYGDEVAIDGYTEHDAGFRYPMPWGRVSERGKMHFDLIKRMAHLKREEEAFSGGRKVIYAEGRILAVARFTETQTYVGVISMEEEEKTIDLPLALIGMSRPDGRTDAFGDPLTGESIEKGVFRLTVGPCGSCLFKCK